MSDSPYDVKAVLWKDDAAKFSALLKRFSSEFRKTKYDRSDGIGSVDLPDIGTVRWASSSNDPAIILYIPAITLKVHSGLYELVPKLLLGMVKAFRSLE
jgi:hypothetical protein